MSEGSPAVLEPATRDDVHARRLLQCALGAFQKWPEGFAGFAAAIRCREGHDHLDGDVCVLPGGRVDVHLAHGALAAWATASLSAISLARTPRFFKDGDGRFPVTLEPEDEHPLGRSVRVHLAGPAWRTYRIDAKGRIRQQENAEPGKRATATYDGFVRTCPGRVLPTRIHILEWDVMAQAVIETADIEEAYERRGHVWLPLCRRARVTHVAGHRELVLELSGHRLL